MPSNQTVGCPDPRVEVFDRQQRPPSGFDWAALYLALLTAAFVAALWWLPE